MTVYRDAGLKTLAKALGTSPILRLVCTSTAINPMAKYKPIRHRANGPITDVERRGEIEDIANGIVYGLKVGVDGNILANIHSADWSYVGKPTGGIGVAPYRQQDLDGYDTNAVPDLYGEIPTAAYYNIEEPFSVQLIRNPNNTTGVLLNEVMALDYSQLYLCVAVGNYATQLTNKKMGGYYPVVHNGTEGNFFGCPAFPNVSALQSSGNKTVTVFLAPSAIASKMQGSWMELSEDGIEATNVCTIPYAANKTVSFSYISTIPEVVTLFTASISGSRITYSWVTGKDWSRFDKKRIIITLSQITGGKETEAPNATVTEITSETSQSYYLSDLVTEAGWFGGMGDTFKAMALFQYYSGNQWNTAMYTSTSFTY